MQFYPVYPEDPCLWNKAYGTNSCGGYLKPSQNIRWDYDPEVQAGSSCDYPPSQDGFSPIHDTPSPVHDDVSSIATEEQPVISFNMSSISCVDGVKAEQLVSVCRKSLGCFTTLMVGSPDQRVTTLTGQDLIDLNDADKNPDLLFTLDAFHLYSTLPAEDVTQFLCGLEKMVNLKELTLNAPLNDTQLNAILTRHPNLEKLVLRDVTQLTDKGFAALAERGSQYKTLSLSGCSKSLTSGCINGLFASLSKVEIFTLFGQASVEAKHLKTLLSNASEMTYGYLSTCEMTRESVKKVFEKVKHHERLERLSLSGPTTSENQLLRAFYKQPNQAFKLNDRFDLLIDGQLVT